MRRGAEYLESLRDGREVWFNGEKVKDVTAHPTLRRSAQTIARLYDLQHDPQYAYLLTFTDSEGKQESMAHFIPRSAEDLNRLRKYYELIGLKTGSLWGRFSSLMELWHVYSMGPVDVYQKYNPVWLENMRAFWDHWVKRDLWVCGMFGVPSGDKSKPVSEQEDLDAFPRVVERRSDGMVVNGIKSGSLPPLANEIYVVPWPLLRENEGDWALAFCIPAHTKGVKIVCRESLTTSESPFEYPLSTFFDEIDGHVIFDHVFVPEDRIFCVGAPKAFEEILWQAGVAGISSRLAPGTIPYSVWISQIQTMVRLRLMLGVVYLMAQASGAYKAQSPALIDALSELIQIYQQVKAFVMAAEADPSYGPTGMAIPRPSVIYAGRHVIYDSYYRALCRFHELIGGTPVISPREKDLQDPEIGPYLEKYFKGIEVNARRRLQIIRLAKDLGINSAAGRMLLFNHHADAPRETFKRQITAYFEDLGEARECIESVESLLKGS